jgi:hypothetical protein
MERYSLLLLSLLIGVPAQAGSIISSQISFFTGGDAGEGLDLAGDFAYAIDLTPVNTTHTVQGATFSPIGEGSGTVQSPSFTVPGVTVPTARYQLARPTDFGASSNDDALEDILLGFIQNDRNQSNELNIDVVLEPNSLYKLQLLIWEGVLEQSGLGLRVMDLFVEGVLVGDDIDSIALGACDRCEPLQGLLVSAEISSGSDTNLDIDFVQAGPNPDMTLYAFTVERLGAVPEPNAVVLLGLGLGGLFASRRLRDVRLGRFD